MSDEACRIESELANKLMHKYNVYINIRRKPKQGITSVVVKGIERCAGEILLLYCRWNWTFIFVLIMLGY